MESTIGKIRLTPQLDVAIDDIVLNMSDLETTDLELFMNRVGRLLANRRSRSASNRETVLLKKINAAIPQNLQQNYEKLALKLQEETITTEEHKAFLMLIDELELCYADRLKNLIELSHLRGVSLEQLMQDLHLNVIVA
jgi:preprotein translocase subunit SecA